jgi:hypothetical protein
VSTTTFGDVDQGRPDSNFADWPPERAVLAHLLDQHPRRLTIEELAHEVGSGPTPAAVERAVSNLAAARFVTREGAELAPAPTVVSFDRSLVPTKF